MKTVKTHHLRELKKETMDSHHCDHVSIVATAQSQPQSHPLMLSHVQAGFATWAEDAIDKNLSLDDYLIEHDAATFLVRVEGESMLEAGILPGDVLVVDRSLPATHGQIVIAVVDGDLTVKKFYQHGHHVELHAENHQFPKIIIPEGSQVEIWGVVTGVVRKMSHP